MKNNDIHSKIDKPIMTYRGQFDASTFIESICCVKNNFIQLIFRNMRSQRI